MFDPKLIVLQPTPYCNINCSYCYLGGRNSRHVMSGILLERISVEILSQIPSHSCPLIVWHAGEPLTVSLDWYKNAYQILTSAAPAGMRFAMQTNGIAMTPEWVEFLRYTGTSVGLSIDGPQRFHDARRRTRRSGPTWELVRSGLALLQEADIFPQVICVLSPESLQVPQEFYQFFADHNITNVSFSIDELEGINASSSFDGVDHKPAMIQFLVQLLRQAQWAGYPLRIREMERIAALGCGIGRLENEQVRPWDIVTVDALGNVSTFSPEAAEAISEEYGGFIFGNLLNGSLVDCISSPHFRTLAADIADGVASCRAACRYFDVCGGGAPINKFVENGTVKSTETQYCRLGTQAAADALTKLMGEELGPRGEQTFCTRRPLST